MGRGRKRHRRHSPPVEKPTLPPIEIAPPIEHKLELVRVVPEDVEDIWPLAFDLLATEIPKTDWLPEHLCWACANDQAILWMVCDGDDAIAAMVTIFTPMRRCLVVVCSGRNLFEFVEARHQLYDVAKEAGMKEVTFYGRDALVKLMPECKRAGVILRKEL